MREILGIIPARGGSKGIPRKNIVPLAGRPLISYSIRAARESGRMSRVVVSTDDIEIADVARREGAEVPYLRPVELAGDATPTLPVIQDMLRFLQEEPGFRPWAVVLLQPTSPLRTARHIDEAVALLEETGSDSVVSVIEVPHSFNPVSLMRIVDGRLVPFLEGEGTRVLRRQDIPLAYARNGPAVLVTRYETLMEKNDLYGSDCRPYPMDRECSIDIDSEFDLAFAEAVLSRPAKR